jgi:transcriptional regulator with XRE-family HTH domain
MEPPRLGGSRRDRTPLVRRRRTPVESWASDLTHRASVHDPGIGSAFRAVRIRRGWRQLDLAARARVSRSVIAQAERGDIGRMPLETLDRIAAALEIRLRLQPSWRGGDLGRLLKARHSALNELVARYLSTQPGWKFVPEVSFSIYGERGLIDIFAWHAPSRSLLVIELKTEIVDLEEMIGTLDRKRRLAVRIARESGLIDVAPKTVSVWVIVADGRTNRRHVSAHRIMLRAALPADGWTMRRWVRDPSGSVAGLSLWSYVAPGGVSQTLAARMRVRTPNRAGGHAQKG